MGVPRRSRRPGRGFRRGTRSPSQWSGAIANSTLASDSKVALAVFTPVGGGSHVTPIRVVGILTFEFAATPSLGTGALGMGVFSDQAILTGVAALPDPITDIGDDLWMLIVPLPVVTNTRRATIEFDSRAMRKVEDGQSLVLIAAQTATGVTLELSVYLRVLSKIAVRS